MKVKTAELSGRALDWAVALSTGQYEMTNVPEDIDGKNSCCILAPTGLVDNGFRWPPRGKVGPLYFIKKYSTDWSQCGYLIDRFDVDISPQYPGYFASAKMGIRSFGDTRQIAICRAVVASKLGDEVDIPDELMETTK